ncbi:IS701 family transposase, partial [Frankia sp. Cj3]|uniref:IS701 family transposase n=1 Tax=Frankia sp. Cj3 TaxID=2880976 RepID=UPI001EF3E45F
MASCPSVDPDRWSADFEAFAARLDRHFRRVESRQRMRRFLHGMMSELQRVNCWTLAQHAGEGRPGPMQHFLSKAVMDDNGLRADLRDYVTETLGHPEGVLVIDETGDLKKGTATIGVQRQYTGTAGRIENAQVAVYLTYASPIGHALIDNALYMPKSWMDDPARRAAAGAPEDLTFATKPELAQGMIERALDAGTQAHWVTGDEVYGANPGLRAAIARRGTGYVLAVAKSETVATKAGPKKAIDIAVTLPDHAWNRISAGHGAKGERLYDWAIIEVTDGDLQGRHYLMIRRSIGDGEYAFYRTQSPTRIPLRTFVRVAGIRWSVEDDFQSCKELTALDEHQVRRWTPWHRWTLIAMLAYAFLAVTTARAHTIEPAKGLIPLTVHEVR